MPKTTEQLINLLEAGGALSLDAKSKPFSQLKRLAEVSSETGAKIWLRNSQERATKQLVELCAFNTKGNLIFVIE